jgi:hypothetical protein
MSNLPIKSDDNFIAECETMDLSDLKNKSFVVSVSQGDRGCPKFISSTMRGPYTFVEMCEEVGMMWAEEQHHARATILQKDRKKTSTYLDANTIDYIEAHYTDIVTESMLDGVFDDEREFTCRAGILEADAVDNANKPQEELPDALVETTSP